MVQSYQEKIFFYTTKILGFIRLLRGVLFNRGKHKRDYLKNASMDDIDMIQNIYKNMKLDFERGENI